MMSLRSKVLRDGSQILVDSSDIVPWDVIYIEEGDKIPADGYLLTLNNLETAEAVLTGESLPIKKNLSVTIHDVPLWDQKNMVFSWTTVTQWNGTYVVTTTGMQTQIWSIATMIDNIKPKTTHLQKKLEKLSKVIGIVVIVICIMIFLTYYFINGLDLTSAFLSSVALSKSYGKKKCSYEKTTFCRNIGFCEYYLFW
jgi:Ca2+-transporting ATPase